MRNFQPHWIPSAILCSLLVFPLYNSALVTAAQAASPTPANSNIKLEKVEWTWADRSDPVDGRLPNILLVGDSITRAYFPEVAKQFAGKANVYLFATSCSAGDPRLPEQLQLFFQGQPSFSVIHFNNGMHGWDYDDQTFATAIPEMVKTLKAYTRSSRLIWATITPVRNDNPHGANNARIDARNAAALKFMHNNGILVDDQHALMSTHNDLHLDDVHYNDAGCQLQGDQAAAIIQPLLSTLPVPAKH